MLGLRNSRQSTGVIVLSADWASPYTGILQKVLSSFRMYGNLLIILVLRAEGCSGIFQPNIISFGCGWKIVRLRLENHSAEIGTSFGAELFHSLQWKEAERFLKHPSFYNELYDRKLGFGMKDEGTFCKTLGREAKCDGIPVGWYTICFSIVSQKIPAEYL